VRRIQLPDCFIERTAGVTIPLGQNREHGVCRLRNVTVTYLYLASVTLRCVTLTLPVTAHALGGGRIGHGSSLRRVA
jgi:hypothetical protein